MITTEFEERVTEARNRDPVLFALVGDPPATESEIAIAEEELNLRLPALLRWFLSEYGAGYFALTVIYSLDRRSRDSIWSALELPWVARHQFLPVADNGAGDYYGFRIGADGGLMDEIFVLDHESEQVREEAEFDDFLDFVATVGLHAG